MKHAFCLYLVCCFIANTYHLHRVTATFGVYVDGTMTDLKREDLQSDRVFTLHCVQGGTVLESPYGSKTQNCSLKNKDKQFWQVEFIGDDMVAIKNFESKQYLAPCK